LDGRKLKKINKRPDSEKILKTFTSKGLIALCKVFLRYGIALALKTMPKDITHA
jgi:hypothetical protein